MTKILMVRPLNFGFNHQTADSNVFQHQNATEQNTQQFALAEFDNMVAGLQANAVEVIVIDDTANPIKPDAVFPNNWVSFHENGQVFLYPMNAPNRRFERREDIMEGIKANFSISAVTDLSYFEAEGKFLEGTGSMVFNRDLKLAYACISPRTNADVLNEFCNQSGYKQVSFRATDAQNLPIYHTNVMMSIGNYFVVICMESITDPIERDVLKASFAYSGKEVIEISLEQMNNFAGNILQVENREGMPLLVMSARAKKAFRAEQIKTLSKYAKIVDFKLDTIENIGGGSARCMMAEVFLPHLD